jgi:DNA-binding response OmpR family regulator
MGHRILLLEDPDDIAALLALHLGDLGYTVTVAPDAACESFDLLLLDWQLPGTDALEVCRELRENGARIPILMLSARTSETDRVLGLEMGADDFLCKPVSVMELCARVKALIRRADRAAWPMPVADQIRAEGLHIDIGRHEVLAQGAPVALTAKEFDLLAFLARHPGRVFSRAQLLEQVWGYGHDGYDHTVNSHINRLRNKIEPDPANPRHILTVWSVGYKFRDQIAQVA